MKQGNLVYLSGEGRLAESIVALIRWIKKVHTPMVISIGLVAAGVLLHFIAGRNPESVEHWYSRRVFPHIARVQAAINHYFGFSCAELLIFILGLACLGFLIFQIRRLMLRKIRLVGLLKSGFWKGMAAFGGLVLVFQLLWGLNYSRLPLAINLGMAHHQPSQPELALLCHRLIAEANTSFSAAQPSTNPDVGSRMPFSRQELYNLLELSYQQETWMPGFVQSRLGPPKPVYSSRVMTYLGISGVYSPFTGEPNFNAEQPDCELPFTIAHEMAHQRGFAFEDEANFVAFLVCTKSGNPYCRYSGFLAAARYVLVSLALTPDQYRELRNQFTSGPDTDLKAIWAFWTRYRGPLRRVSESVNDTYLKANGVGTGVENYSQVVQLLADYYAFQPNPDKKF